MQCKARQDNHEQEHVKTTMHLQIRDKPEAARASRHDKTLLSMQANSLHSKEDPETSDYSVYRYESKNRLPTKPTSLGLDVSIVH